MNCSARAVDEEFLDERCPANVALQSRPVATLVACAAILLLPLFRCSAPAQQAGTQPAPIVRTEDGGLRGQMRGNLAVFQGIPFAAPPVGKLRWREPKPVAPWSGVRDATRPGSACVQSAAGLNPFIAPLAAAYGAPYTVHPIASSEDCLYLNVWVPEWPPKAAQPAPGLPAPALPVMVWLHGGSNTAGSGAQSTYDGASLATRGVILITVNYRLGVMGFFSHPELAAESPHHTSGNYGLQDQLAALLWVRQNIAAFGGDASNVTLFGESAGSIDAGMLLASPQSTGLFRRVILESGPPFGLGTPRTRSEAEAVGASIAKAAPGGSASTLENLRRMPAAQVVELAASVEKAQFKGFDPNSPTIDGWLLTQAPARTFATAAMQKAEVMVGLNGRELSAFRVAAAAAPKTSGKPMPAAGAGDALRGVANTTRPLYGNWTGVAIAAYLGAAVVYHGAAIDQATNDMLMACPIGALGALTSAAGQHAYIYQFDRSIPGKGQPELGAFHGLEVLFVFNAFDDPAWRWLPFTAADRQLSNVMENYWTNFAKTGNPNAAGLPMWDAWNENDEPYMEFAANATAVPRRSFAPPFCHLSSERIRSQLTKN